MSEVVVHAQRSAGASRPDERLLDPAERARLGQFSSAAARERYLISHVFLRTVLAAHLGVEPAAIGYERSCEHCGHPDHGRPRLASGLGSVDFSLSHSGGWTLVAVGGGPVGADIEDLDRRPITDGVVLRSATVLEQAALPAVGDPARHRETLALWTRKEAVAKALGLGVVLPFASFDATPGRPVRVGPAGGPSLVVHPVGLGPGAVAAVAVPVGAMVRQASF